jgi:hypothetical protein
MQNEFTIDADEAAHVASEAGAIVADNEDGQWASMSYEQGVRDALQWVLGDTDQHPLEEHPSFRAKD